QNHTNRPLTDFGGKTSIFSHPVYLFLREFSLQDFRGGSDRPFRATNLSRDIDNVRALLAHLLYHVKVLSAQHVDVLSGVRTLRKQHVGWSGQSKW
ncbi:hypothetical protein ACP8YP_26320, partial [Escherichia coli]